MTANELLELIRLGGYSIVVNGESLNVSPSFSIDDEMAQLITANKPELIELLNEEQGVRSKLTHVNPNTAKCHLLC